MLALSGNVPQSKSLTSTFFITGDFATAVVLTALSVPSPTRSGPVFDGPRFATKASGGPPNLPDFVGLGSSPGVYEMCS